MKDYTIAVAGTGYVGLSLAVLLTQHNKVYVVDIIPEKQASERIPQLEGLRFIMCY